MRTFRGHPPKPRHNHFSGTNPLIHHSVPNTCRDDTFLFFFFIAELFIGTWYMTKELQDPRLAKVAESLPFLIQSSWAESTNDKYRRGWNNWSKWCEKYPEAGRCPADPFYIALFFNEIVISKHNLSYLTTAHSGIPWGHLNAGHRSPTEHPFARMAFAQEWRLKARENCYRRTKSPLRRNLLL